MCCSRPPHVVRPCHARPATHGAARGGDWPLSALESGPAAARAAAWHAAACARAPRASCKGNPRLAAPRRLPRGLQGCRVRCDAPRRAARPRTHGPHAAEHGVCWPRTGAGVQQRGDATRIGVGSRGAGRGALQRARARGRRGWHGRTHRPVSMRHPRRKRVRPAVSPNAWGDGRCKRIKVECMRGAHCWPPLVLCVRCPGTPPPRYAPSTALLTPLGCAERDADAAACEHRGADSVTQPV